ncbi:hypothetical protein E2C01_063209 [Portunus trituberculatus]|uniref:Uncharacterized protein n=1 Tax=Portunus trituberculatus TaxID=210409 RepID=A0A5B7HGG1_PORTR|nr:hypothetical protein [Portunus trituberculatus]
MQGLASTITRSYTSPSRDAHDQTYNKAETGPAAPATRPVRHRRGVGPAGCGKAGISRVSQHLGNMSDLTPEEKVPGIC